MKNSLVALAALAAAGAASAQSSVTLFGVVDATISSYQNKSENPLGAAVKVSRTLLTNNGLTSTRLGFRGTEDLGGGLAAHFWLEAAVFPDDGTTGGNVANSGPSVTGFFNRRSTLSLSGDFGEIRLGRDYTPTYQSDSAFDPFGGVGAGTNLILTANGFGTSAAPANGFQANSMYARASNSVGYLLPPGLGGVYGQVMYAFNEKDKYDPGTLTPNVRNNSRAGGYVGGRVGYAKGPLDLVAAYGQSTIADAYFAGLTTRLDSFNIASSYNFGVVKLFGEYSKVKLKTQNDGIVPIGAVNASPAATGYLLGLTAPVGPGLIRFAYSQVKIDTNRNIPQLNGDPKADKWAIGYVHNLSKRTALYATYARIKNRNGYDLCLSGSPQFITSGTFQPKTSVGYDFGLRHTF